MEFNDVRFEFMSEYTLKSMKLKADKWAKLQGNDEYRQAILDFFEKPEHNILIIYQNNAGQLQPTSDFPTSMKAKAVYFSKKEKGMNVGKDNYKTALTYGDLSYSPLEQLSALVDEILVPLLSNSRNHEQWPAVLAQSRSLMQWKLKKRVKPFDRGLVHSIESVIIEWTHQIQSVLKRNSAQPLLEGHNPGPLVELDFWRARATNLECIFQQLHDVKVRRMAELLEKTQSSYFPAFKKIFKDVVAALEEARDITMHLKPLRRLLDDMEQFDFSELDKIIPAIIHTVGLVWANSKYYCRAPRMIVLLQELCNMLIEMARTYLDPAEIFKSEAEEAYEKTRKAVQICSFFQETFEDVRRNIPKFFKEGEQVKQWEFANELVFTRMDQFILRLKTVEDLFATTMEFSKLEKVELGGIKGKMLSHQVVEIFSEFNEIFSVFGNRTYDGLDATNGEFVEDYNQFRERIADLDRRLASIVCQGFDDCPSTEAALKLLDCFGSLLDPTTDSCRL
ncbi:hypothetical protein OS493_003218 [Desmophyllum pertusum]|uniref:Dynein heavy chain tail domain-containing protein n=1 Tax=Desmophyllum pertusum TaxID=174260 RepID=A0A9W9YGX1_9CNID|nr:hypothetical protein OS493_003218 [Desmophyllum pertusum]